MADTLLVRLHPISKRQGYVMENYHYAGIRFQAGRGWMEVPRTVAEYLRGVHEIPDNPASPLAFDVCTRAEAEKKEAEEKRNAEMAVAAANAPRVSPMVAGDFTTDDLPRSEPAPAPEPAPPAKAPKGRRASRGRRSSS